MDHPPARGDAGLSVLEMLVALAVCALVLAVIGASLQSRKPSMEIAYPQIATFVESARLKAMLSGQASTIAIASDRLIDGNNNSVVWDPSKVGIVEATNRTASVVGQRLALLPDGTAVGPALTIRDAGGEHTLPLLLRIR